MPNLTIAAVRDVALPSQYSPFETSLNASTRRDISSLLQTEGALRALQLPETEQQPVNVS